MKELHGSARTEVSAPPDRCLALLAAVEDYPRWYPEVVRRAEVVETGRDGRPSQVRAILHVSHGPLVKDFQLLLAVGLDDPRQVKLTRVPHDSSDPERFAVTWTVAERFKTEIALGLDANLSVPRFVPLGGVGDALAAGFVAAAAWALADQPT